MPDQLFELFDEYAAAYARGERPSAENYLERAGAAREQLASLLDEFLRRTPVRPPSRRRPALARADARRRAAASRAAGGTGHARRRRGRCLIDRLGLEPAKRAKVKRYYQRLEGGLLDPLGNQQASAMTSSPICSEQVPRSRFAGRLRPPQHPRSYGRPSTCSAVPTVAAPSAEARDEIDELFTGGG